MIKSAVKTVLRPLRAAGGRFFIRMPDTIIWKAAQISLAELIEGDYLEFGVFRGDSFIQAFSTIRSVHREWSMDSVHSPKHRGKLQEIWNNMRFFAFDSFQGLPELKGLDRRSSDFARGHYAYALPDFLKNLKSCKADLGKVLAVPGWFEDTCTEETIKKYNMKAASIVHIDCDLYESTKTVLEFIEPLLVDGTVLIFDDWYSFRGNPDLGEQRAFAEWAQGKSDWAFTQYQKEGPTRNSFIANRTMIGRPEGFPEQGAGGGA